MDQPFAQSGCLCACVSVYCSTCVCVSVCVKNQTFWCREALTPNFRCEQGKTAVPDDASNWKMLIVTAQHSRPPQRRLAARTSRTRATAHALSSCLLAIGAVSGPSTRWFVGDQDAGHVEVRVSNDTPALIRSLRKSRRFRRHHLPTRCSLRFPSWKRRAKRQQSIKAACAARSRFLQAESCDLAMCLSKLAAMNLEVICDVQEVASTITASAMTK
jgi:hypothetical protein